jgi:Cache domain
VIGSATAIAALVGMIVLALEQLHDNTLTEIQVNLLRQSLILSELVERTFQSVDLVLGVIAEKIEIDEAAGHGQEISGEDYYLMLRDRMKNLTQVDALGILSADGKRLNYSRDWPSLSVDLSAREYFRALKISPAIKSFVGEPVQGVTSGEWAVMLARPILSSDKGFLGVVFASTLLEYFTEMFRSTSLGDGYAATLMREDGLLLARFPAAGKVGTVTPTTVLKQLAHSRSGVSRAISPLDGQARIAAAYHLKSYPLVVIVTQNEGLAFAVWRATVITITLISSAVVVAILFATVLLARSRGVTTMRLPASVEGKMSGEGS